MSLQLIAGSGTSLSVSAIDDRGTLAGMRYGNATEQVFRFNPRLGRIKTFHPPRAALVFPVAISRFGEIAGSFIDTKNVPHAYVRKDGV